MLCKCYSLLSHLECRDYFSFPLFLFSVKLIIIFLFYLSKFFKYNFPKFVPNCHNPCCVFQSPLITFRHVRYSIKYIFLEISLSGACFNLPLLLSEFAIPLSFWGLTFSSSWRISSHFSWIESYIFLFLVLLPHCSKALLSVVFLERMHRIKLLK